MDAPQESLINGLFSSPVAFVPLMDEIPLGISILDPLRHVVFINRALGPYAWAYWTMISCNVLVPQLFWFRRFRRSIPVMFVASILINVGMWFERFVIVVTLSRDFLPSSWGYYKPTWVDWGTYLGTFGLFFTFFLLFLRFLPMIAMAELKNVMPQADPHHRPAPQGRG